MLTYLKPGDIYQKNDIVEFFEGSHAFGIPPGVIGVWPYNGIEGMPVLEIDMKHKPRRWTPDKEYPFGWAHWTHPID